LTVDLTSYGTLSGTWNAVVGNGAGSASYTTTFTNATLAAGILTVTHNLYTRVAQVIVSDNNYKTILPDEVTSTGLNTLTVDLTSFGVITGTWNIRVTA
jgi:hypothetical protein